MMPIYKRKNYLDVCENYQVISLVNYFVKVYERMIEKRLRVRIEAQLGYEQYEY